MGGNVTLPPALARAKLARDVIPRRWERRNWRRLHGWIIRLPDVVLAVSEETGCKEANRKPAQVEAGVRGQTGTTRQAACTPGCK